jgi:hypothetical protein
MSTKVMDPVFATALREELVAFATVVPRARRRWRWRAGAGLFVGLSLAVGGAALATGLFSPPGGPIDTALGKVVTATRTGSATIDVGTPPTGATDISLTLTCLTAGTFDFPNGSSMICSEADMNRPASQRQAFEIVALTSDNGQVRIRTSASSEWTLQAVYVNQVKTNWGVNAEGQTYGVPNQNGTPELIAVVINQGKTGGYVTKRDLDCASGDYVSSPSQAVAWDQQNYNISIPVYENDGTTVIGQFVVGNETGANASTIPISSLPPNCLPG